MQKETILDVNGDALAIGSLVRAYGDNDCRGTVTGISDYDADCDEGVWVASNPKVAVIFTDGTADQFSTDSTADGGPKEIGRASCRERVSIAV